MKKIYLLLLISFVSFNSNAQTVVNGGFENWTNNIFYEDPDNWTTLNLLALTGVPETAIKSTDSHSGTYALELKTVAFINGSNQADTMIGYAFSAAIGGGGGFPVNSRPQGLSCYYKYNKVGLSIGYVTVTLSKWNSITNKSDSVGWGVTFIPYDQTSYTQLDVPILYFSSETPDSAFIWATCGGGDPADPGVPSGAFAPGTSLKLDDFSFYGTTDIEENKLANISVYPNPAQNDLNILNLGTTKEAFVRIYNVFGQLQKEIFIEDEKNLVSVSELKKGIYLYQITDIKGRLLNTGKLIKD
jgi:hypothetical protein